MKKEKKVVKTIMLHNSVVEEVKKRNENGSFSGLIENLLISWCYKADRLEALEKKLEVMSDEDILKKIQKDNKKGVLCDEK